MVAVTKLSSRPTQFIDEDDDVWGNMEWLKVLLYGKSGTGKTTLAATFQAPLLWIMTSGGKQSGELKSVKTPENVKRITPINIRSSDTLKLVLAGKHPRIGDLKQYTTIVHDHASGLASLLLKEKLGLDSIPLQKSFGMASREDYGEVAIQMKTFLNEILSLPCNTILIAHEKAQEEDNGTGEAVDPSIGADLSKSVLRMIRGLVDYEVQTYKEPKYKIVPNKGVKGATIKIRDGVEYRLRTGPHDIYYTKFRKPKERELPEYISDPTYDKMLAVINGKYDTKKPVVAEAEAEPKNTTNPD